jgi:ParB family chromosome partitioning protein
VGRTRVAFDTDSRQALFADCVALSVNAVHESWNRRPRVLAHADRVAGAVDLDVAAAGWSPTVDNYLGRVTKARQRRDGGKGTRTACLLWLAARTTAHTWSGDHDRIASARNRSPVATGGEESAPIGGETAMAESNAAAEDGPVATEPHAVAAE